MCRQQSFTAVAPAQKVAAACAATPFGGDEIWTADSDSECDTTASESECESDFEPLKSRAGVPTSKVLQPAESLPYDEQPAASVVDMAAVIRHDNERLRDAIVKMQRDAEAAMLMPGPSAGVDFAHLLALVKDFGDGLGGLGLQGLEPETPAGAEAAGAISISTPRGGRSPAKTSEAAQLRAEIAASRREAADIRGKLAVRKAEIAVANAAML